MCAESRISGQLGESTRRRIARTEAPIRFLAATLADDDLSLHTVNDQEVYGSGPAWSILYCGRDCKVQLFWSSRDGGIYVMLAPPSAASTFGLSDRTSTWQFMLALSDAEDDLPTPDLRASNDEIMSWLSGFFLVHFPSVLRALRSEEHAPPAEGPPCPI